MSIQWNDENKLKIDTIVVWDRQLECYRYVNNVLSPCADQGGGGGQNKNKLVLRKTYILKMYSEQ